FGGGGGGGGLNGLVGNSISGGNGGDGGFGSGGGGGGVGATNGSETSQAGRGGDGGFGGGGGGEGEGRPNPLNITGGGNGGFGGGGGSGFQGLGGTSLFGGGGGQTHTGQSGKGGGGAAMGGAIFIQNGADLIIRTGISFNSSTLTPGTGANYGTAKGTDVFMMSEGSITVENLSINSTVPNPIESDIGAGGGDPSIGGLTLDTGNTAIFSLNGANTYTGSTTINSGALNLQGSVITPVTLNNGIFTGNASLIPNGAVANTGNLTVNGGTVAPGGFSFGTINVGNNLTFTGGTFLTKIDSVGNAAVLDANGTAALAGTLTVNSAEGNFLKGQTITVLNAYGGVSGTFGTENFPSGGLASPLFAVQYTGNQVQILVLRDHVFVRPIIDPGNPRHVAKYMLSQLPIDPNSDFGFVIRSLGVLTDKELNKVLKMMHQGVFGTFEFMNMTTNAQVMQMFNQHPFRLFAPVGPETISALEPRLTTSLNDTLYTYNRETTEDSQPFYPSTPLHRGCERDYCKHHSFHFQPFGTWNSQSQKGELRGFNYENAGFLTGYDYFYHNFFVGVGAGYAYTNFRWDQSAGSGHIHQVYGGPHLGYFNRYFAATLASMAGGNFYETDRNIISSAPSHPNAALNRTAHSHNTGFQWTNDLGLIGDFSPLSVPLQIFANITHFYLHNESFKETGAESINLRVNAKTSNALRSELGVSSSYTFKINHGCWTPYARISWVNKTLLSNSTYRGGFRGQVGTFSASATTKGTNQWAPGAGIEFANLSGLSLLLNTRAEINGKMKNYSADMRMELAF
ncbi:MAG: autotransporter domain-containing protein, partial [Chlamydiia bacterium]|nr:autotransporter domain-containing protein [Chlamydiia bacterium]